ncbi:hypothetical protein FIBSPDRAFT_891516 [Athelia psychrophila]|uniref:Uncharacterized protein n=1 Tax=Athelia psychrophila TaxID=1759441 RepID=A0A166JJ32_9AGAM|nr:hypothetical protein FIBSPDRAFT_891516 [Fibularhizoctonia sp. CBS 109695]
MSLPPFPLLEPPLLSVETSSPPAAIALARFTSHHEASQHAGARKCTTSPALTKNETLPKLNGNETEGVAVMTQATSFPRKEPRPTGPTAPPVVGETLIPPCITSINAAPHRSWLCSPTLPEEDDRRDARRDESLALHHLRDVETPLRGCDCISTGRGGAGNIHTIGKSLNQTAYYHYHPAYPTY